MTAVRIVNQSPWPLPAYATVGSAGMDIQAHITDAITLAPGQRLLIPTGLFIELPIGLEAQLRPRSGLAFKHGITLPNSPATIDSDYRGEIRVALINLSSEPYTIQPGDRVAQLVIARYETIQWTAVDQLSDTARGSGGFGSTGQ